LRRSGDHSAARTGWKSGPQTTGTAVFFRPGAPVTRGLRRNSEPGLIFGRGRGRTVVSEVLSDPEMINMVMMCTYVHNLLVNQKFRAGTGAPASWPVPVTVGSVAGGRPCDREEEFVGWRLARHGCDLVG
jgi:hypothetical protein